MELNGKQLNELKDLYDEARLMAFGEHNVSQEEFEREYPELTMVLATYEVVGESLTTHDLSRWPLVNGQDCSPENLQEWINCWAGANVRADRFRDAYDELNAYVQELESARERIESRFED